MKIHILLALAMPLMLLTHCSEDNGKNGDKCADVICGTNASCKANSGECACDTGFYGDPNISCTATRPCEAVTCGSNASCNAASGKCACKNGFSGDANTGCIATNQASTRVRLDGGLKLGTSIFDGKVFQPLTSCLSKGIASNSDEGIQKSYPIAGTVFDALYQRETWVSSEPATFIIPIDNGNYTVHLHFVDWVNTQPGKRQFHVDVQGERRLTDFDIVAEAGPSTAIVKSYDIVVSDETVTVTITNSVFYAEIAAIEILPVGEKHLPITDLPVCGVSDAVCPAACSAAKDVDCPASACLDKAVSLRCLCGTTEVSSGYCCDGKAQDNACVVSPAFYVWPNGNDANAGTSADKPFKTLEKARDSARVSTTIKTIYLLEGVYNRSQTLQLKWEDSGQSWLAFPGHKPILEGNGTTAVGIQSEANDLTIRWLTLQNFVGITIWLGWGDGLNVTIDSNTILNTLSTDWSQAAIYVCCGNHTGLKVTHNLIDGANYIGIMVGASEGSKGLYDNALIGHNKVHNTCRTVHDCGGIYVWEKDNHISKDVIIDNNVVGDVNSGTGSRGIYLDDNSSNAIVRNNIVYGSGQWSFQFHGGHNNSVTNNIFDISKIDSTLGLYQDTQDATPAEKMKDNRFFCNIVYSDAARSTPLWQMDFSTPVDPPSVNDNLYWGTKGALPNTAPIIDTNPRVADPGFVDPTTHNYSFNGPNPAGFCGFKPIDVSRVGPLSN